MAHNYWTLTASPLEMYLGGTFISDMVHIRKGNSVVVMSPDLSDLLDIHGMNATVEMTEMICLQLEYGTNFFGQIGRQQSRMDLSDEEKRRIFDMVQLCRQNMCPLR